ncbi:MAG: hypothetical protein AB3N64_04435 [Puniceicoccaceae bacterium]
MKLPIRNLMNVLILAGICGLLAAPATSDAASERVQVILVEASNGEGGVDSSLRAYAGTLQRLFKFKSYKQLSRNSLRLDVPGEGSVSLAGGQKLTLRASDGSKRGLMAELTWARGSKKLLHTRIQLRSGSPAVLGGPSTGRGGTYLLILVMD